jgi:hypothetical protein
LNSFLGKTDIQRRNNFKNFWALFHRDVHNITHSFYKRHQSLNFELNFL